MINDKYTKIQKVKNCNYHKNKIRKNEPKILKNNKVTEAQPKLSGSYKKKCIISEICILRNLLQLVLDSWFSLLRRGMGNVTVAVNIT